MKPAAARSPVLALAVLLLALSPACRVGGEAEEPPQALSLLGEPLYAPALAPERRAELEAELAAARADHEADPTSEEAAIWLGRRLAYLGRFEEAVEVYTHALGAHPESAKLLRHRGHRYITLRRFDLAVEDLTRAAQRMQHLSDEVEPDGQPNALGIPTSTLHTNVHYHLALAHYLLGAFGLAAQEWERCAAVAQNDDMRVAAWYWQVLALARQERHDEAAEVLRRVRPGMEILENRDYHRLLLHFTGELSERELLLPIERGGVSFATTYYGVGAWKLAHGEPEPAYALFEQVVAEGSWPAFGHIAAEAELARAGR